MYDVDEAYDGYVEKDVNEEYAEYDEYDEDDAGDAHEVYEAHDEYEVYMRGEVRCV